LIEELDFSEEACIERYVISPNFDEDRKRRIHLDGLPCDDIVVCTLNSYGYINANWDICETVVSSHDYDDMINTYKH
jgi:hypothetical protein